jgi:leucyl aminopeptidase
MAIRESMAQPAVAFGFSDGDATTVETDALVLTVPPGVDGDAVWQGPLAAVDAALDGALRAALRDAGFSGKVGKTHVLATLGRLPAKRIVATGLPETSAGADEIRRAYGVAATAAKSAGARNAASPPPGGGSDETACYRAAVEGVALALYDFRLYRSQQDEDGAERGIDGWTFLGAETDAARRGVETGYALAAGVYLARDLVFEPGQALYPQTFAAIAQQVARDNELEYREYDETRLAEMGAGAIVAVGMGSVHPPRMMHLTYRPSGASQGTIAFIGKGITFDTGGMNLKPTGGIETMKTDMAGAAAVLGAMRALSGLDLPFTVYGIIASAENMPTARPTVPATSCAR